MEPLGFIDPLKDLGTFDSYHMCFLETVEKLRSPWSGDQYLPKWQVKIEEMRGVYIKWQEALANEKDEKTGRQKRNFVSTASVRKEQRVFIRLCLGLDLQSELYRRKQDMQRKRSVMSIPILDTCTRPKETLMS